MDENKGNFKPLLASIFHTKSTKTSKRKKSNKSTSIEENMSFNNTDIDAVGSCIDDHLASFKQSLLTDMASLIDEKLRAFELRVDEKIEIKCSGIVNSKLPELKEQIKCELKNELGVQENKPLENIEVCVIASNVPSTPNEVPVEKAKEIVDAIGLSSAQVTVTDAKRLNNYNSNRPALLKIAVGNLEQKKLMLRNKIHLATSQHFGKVFLRSSETNLERVHKANTRMLLQSFPEGKNYRITNNGKIVPRSNNFNDGFNNYQHPERFANMDSHPAGYFVDFSNFDHIPPRQPPPLESLQEYPRMPPPSRTSTPMVDNVQRRGSNQYT